MLSRETIENEIRGVIFEVTGISDPERDTNLISRDLGIAPATFLYIFDLLEKRLQLPVHDIFKNHTYDVMTVANLAGALSDLTVK